MGMSTEDRRNFSYFMFGASGLTFAVGAAEGVKAVAMTMNPADDVLALANIEIDLSAIPEEEINAAVKDDDAPMRDVQLDKERVLDPKYLIVLGVCTHLGCVPIPSAGDYHGYFCPCHGSHYDTSGRIRKGPAPLNLEVPPYKFLGDSTVLVGESD